MSERFIQDARVGINAQALSVSALSVSALAVPGTLPLRCSTAEWIELGPSF